MGMLGISGEDSQGHRKNAYRRRGLMPPIPERPRDGARDWVGCLIMGIVLGLPMGFFLWLAANRLHPIRPGV